MALYGTGFEEFVTDDCRKDDHEWCTHYNCECICHEPEDDTIEVSVIVWE